MLGAAPMPLAADPRTPQLRPRRPRQARAYRRPRARSGAGRPDRRRRLQLRARALRGGRDPRRLGDDLRRPLQHRRDRRRGAARRRADPGPAAAARSRSAIAERRGRARPARPLGRRGPASRGAFERLLDELQGAGLEPADVEAAAGDARGLGLPRRPRRALRRLRRGPRRASGCVDGHGIAARGDRGCCAATAGFWSGRPVFLYGFDDLTPNQLDLVAALAAATEVTVAPPLRGRATSRSRPAPALLESLREIGVDSEIETAADPDNTPTPRSSSTSSGTSARPSRSGRAPDGEPALPALRRRARRGGGDRRRGRPPARRRRRPERDRDRPPRSPAARAAARRGARVLRGRRSRSRPRSRSPRPRSAAA